MSFADYDIVGELARSGMGIVIYRARHRSTGRMVSVEMARDVHLDGGSRNRAHLLGRYEAIALLDHPNLLPIFEVGEVEGLLYLVRPDHQGKFLDHHPRPPAGMSAHLVEQLALGIHHAHEHGIFHCDVKPANVLLLAGVPMLAGFDCARVRFLHPPAETDHCMLPEGTLVGTPAFMAPEQAQGKAREFTPAIDVWGLGALLFTLLTGQPPFQRSTVIDTIMALVQEPVPEVRSIEASVPKNLEAICCRCLQKKPEDRYGSALALAEDLGRFCRGEPIEARPLESPSLAVRLRDLMRGWWGRSEG
jgi:serine/threonine-protein kinase